MIMSARVCCQLQCMPLVPEPARVDDSEGVYCGKDREEVSPSCARSKEPPGPSSLIADVDFFARGMLQPEALQLAGLFHRGEKEPRRPRPDTGMRISILVVGK